MPDVIITVCPDGPLKIEGPVRIVGPDGAEIPVNRSDKPRIALCRCGASAAKPFCDGSHKRCGFSDPPPPASPPEVPSEGR